MKINIIRGLLVLMILMCGRGYSSASEYDNFAVADYSQGKVFVFEKGKIVWEHNANEVNDLSVLENGNLLFTTGNGVLEINRAKDTIFYFESSSTITTCQRLANGNTFVGECMAGQLLEVSPMGKIVKRVNLLPIGKTIGGSSFFRNARALDNGNYLVGHYGSQEVKEYNAKGEMVWRVSVPGGCHSVIRLPNGNTIVSVTDILKNPRIMEFNIQGQLVWQFGNEDMQDKNAPLKFIAGIYQDGKGKLHFANWIGHGFEGKAPHVYLIDKSSKTVLWKLDQGNGIRAVSALVFMNNKWK